MSRNYYFHRSNACEWCHLVYVLIFREMREELSTLQGKEAELSHKKSDLEKQLEVAEAETLLVRSQLKVSETRIIDLQAAISGDIDSDKVS